jgi:MOSC domain-containing protein YiiM
VLEEGHISAGDRIDVVHRQGHGITVSTMFRALNLDRSLLPQLLRVDGLAERARVKATAFAEGATSR